MDKGRNNSNLLSRRREIEELTKKVKGLLEQNEDLEKEKDCIIRNLK